MIDDWNWTQAWRGTASVLKSPHAQLERELGSIQVIPNPSTSTVTIRYVVPKLSRVRISICNQQGQVVRALVDEQRPAGVYTVDVDEKGKDGLSKGIYLLQMVTGGKLSAGTMVLMQ